MNESAIRSVLSTDLRKTFRGEPGTIAVSELPIYYGSARADLCVVNGEFLGYEIKGPGDSVVRLARQMEAYRQVFDKVSCVIAEKHLDRTIKIVPETTGISVVTERGNSIAIEPLRPATDHTDLAPEILATLLWREEALTICERYEIARGIRSKPRRDLWKRLAEGLSLTDLRAEVRATLKARKTWDRIVFRIGSVPRRCGG